MKKKISLVLFLAIGLSLPSAAQETPGNSNPDPESPGNFSVSADLVSSYVWRGSKFGKGPAIQPTVKFTSGGFTLGAWGSTCFSDPEAFGNRSLYIIQFREVHPGSDRLLLSPE